MNREPYGANRDRFPDFQRGHSPPGISPADPPADRNAPFELDQLGRPVLQVASRSAGIGDHLLGVSFATGLQRQRRECEVRYVCNTVFHDWLSPFFPALDSQRRHCPLYFLNHDTDHPRFTENLLSRWQWWERQYDVRCELPTVPELPAVPGDELAQLAGRILIAPFAKFADRQWPVEHWAAVERALQDVGYRTLIVHGDDDERLKVFAGDQLTKASPPFVVALSQYAMVTLGNDSGLAHLAGFLERPAVAVCSRASDRNIFGLTSSVKQLGGRQLGADQVDVNQVVAACREQLAGDWGKFPSGQFRALLHDKDRGSHGWEPIYAPLWNIYRELRPQRLVEIGVRAGYSAWCALNASATCHVHGIELGRSDVEGREVDGGFPDAHKHALQICPSRFSLHLTDSHKLESLPNCDTVYIDGDHSEDGCAADLALAARADPKWIVVDDFGNFQAVRDACRKFMARHTERRARFIPSPTGVLVLSLEKL